MTIREKAADTILGKPAPLDDAEWQVMRRHPDIGRGVTRENSRDLGVAIERRVPRMLGFQVRDVGLHDQGQEPGADRAMVVASVGGKHAGQAVHRAQLGVGQSHATHEGRGAHVFARR